MGAWARRSPSPEGGSRGNECESRTQTRIKRLQLKGDGGLINAKKGKRRGGGTLLRFRSVQTAMQNKNMSDKMYRSRQKKRKGSDFTPPSRPIIERFKFRKKGKAGWRMENVKRANCRGTQKHTRGGSEKKKWTSKEMVYRDRKGCRSTPAKFLRVSREDNAIEAASKRGVPKTSRIGEWEVGKVY